MKTQLFKLFSTFFKKEMQAISTHSVEIYKQEEKNRRREFDYAELEIMVGHRVIAISNEWENPLIGVATSIVEITQAKNPRLVIKDYLTGQELVPFGKVYIFTEQRLNAILTLDPFELCSLLYTNFYYDCTYEKKMRSHRDSADIIRSKLQKSGFFEIESLV